MAHRSRTPEEIERSMKAARDIKARQTLAEQKKHIRYAQYALMVIGILQLVFVALIYWLGLGFAWIDIVIGAVFIALYFISREKPALAFNAGLIVYGAIQALVILTKTNQVSTGLTIDLTLIIKIIVFATLISGIAALKRIPKSLMDRKDNGTLDDPDPLTGI